jgi:cell shape-determining protein MreD
MNLQKKNLLFVFLSALALTLFVPVVFPTLKLVFLAPFLIVLLYKKPLITCLWGSLICGLILDILSPHTRLGLYSMNFTLTTGILYAQRRHFFADKASTLPIMTFFFSVISTVIQGVLLNTFEGPFQISWGWLFSDLIVMPLMDASYAFLIFILPYLLFGKPVRKGKDYFLQNQTEG